MKLVSRLIVALFAIASVAAETFTFGIVPQQSAQVLAKTWQPVFNEIARQSDIEFIFRTAPTIPEFEQRVLNGEYDLAYMNPLHFVTFAEQPGYQAVARETNKSLQGIVVTRKDSAATSLKDLQNSKLAFPAPNAFAATVIPLANLAQQNILIEPVYVRTHDSVYLNVLAGNYPAGGGVQRTFNNMPEDVKAELKVLWTTPAYTPHAIAAHPRFSEHQVDQFQQIFTALNASEEGKAALAQLGMTGFSEAVSSDWDDVRELAITLQGLND